MGFRGSRVQIRPFVATINWWRNWWQTQPEKTDKSGFERKNPDPISRSSAARWDCKGLRRKKAEALCRPLPYHLATAPERGKADQPVGVLQEPRYCRGFFSFTTIATCPSVGPNRLAVSFWLRKRISWMFSAAIDFR